MKIRENHLQADRFYHIFNKGINSDLIFFNDENCNYFLKKAKLYLIPYFEVYAYCLILNHFHFVLKTK